MDNPDEIMKSFLDSLRLIERLHRRLLDVIKAELDGAGISDVNGVQALLIYNIGDAVLTAGELRTRGHYLGSNVSYNLKKMVSAGYINHERSQSDKRSVRVSLTPTGTRIQKLVEDLYRRQLDELSEQQGISFDDLQVVIKNLANLEKFWAKELGFAF